MAVQARLQELGVRHHDLEQAIEQEERRPGVDTLKLTTLKREKLQLKDEMENLRRTH